MSGLLALVLAAAAQDPVQTAVALAQEIRRTHATAGDSEVRLRLAEIVRRMSDRASIALSGEPDDPEHRSITIHDARAILSRPPDRRSTDFWRWSRGIESVSEEQAPLSVFDDENLLDFIKERTGVPAWDGENTLSRDSGTGIAVQASPGLQRKVARILSDLEKEIVAEYRITFWVYASARPLSLEAGPDGVLSEAAWEKLAKSAEEGGSVRRLGMIETAARADQTVSSFSGVRRPVAIQLAEGTATPQTVADGLAVEARPIPSGSGVSLQARLAFTKVLGIDEVPTAKGTLRLPRVASAELSELRTVAAGRPVLLGTLGPLPPEAELPPHVTVVVRVSRIRP